MDPRLALLVNLTILAGMLMTLCGLIVPVFPGLIVVWLLALLYGILTLMSRKARQEGLWAIWAWMR